MRAQERTWNCLRKFEVLLVTDLRSLAVFRVALALLLLADLAIRAQALEAHYTDFGVLPRSELLDYNRLPLLHILVGSWQGQFSLGIIAATFASLLLVGFHTRLASIVSWFFLFSLQCRQPLVTSGSDNLLRLLLLWSVFLPLGARFSIDSLRSPNSRQPNNSFCSIAVLGLALQLFYVYFMSGVLKIAEKSWQEGFGVANALAMEQYAKPLGVWIAGSPIVTTVANYATLVFETIMPFFLFLPWQTARVRLGLILASWTFHIGLSIFMSVGLWSVVGMAAWIPFFPSELWDRFQAMFKKKSIAKGWRQVANQPGVTISPTPQQTLSRSLYIESLLTSLILILSLLCNLSAWPGAQFHFLKGTNSLIVWLGIDQKWVMFSKPLASGWYVIPGQLANSTNVDLFDAEHHLRWSRPDQPHAAFPSLRWRKYMLNLMDSKNRSVRQAFSRYLCNKWNREHSENETLLRLQIVFMEQTLQPHGDKRSPKKVLLWDHQCHIEYS